MRKQLVLGVLAAAMALPSMAAAQQSCQEHRTGVKVIGTVIGAGLGALFGNAVAEHGGKPGGTIIGGVAGGVVGNQVAGSGTHCDDQGAAASSGYYDANGRWVSTAQGGYYDRDGRWVSTASGGYYDRDGRWIATAPYAAGAGADVAYRDRDMWAGAPADTRAREDWLESRIRQIRDNGQLGHEKADRALDDLRHIRSQDRQYRQYGGGGLSPRQRGYIQARLDDLRRNLPS